MYLNKIDDARKHFELAIKHHKESVFFLVGLTSVNNTSTEFVDYILNEATVFNSNLHEDGSMETPISYLRNVVETSDFIYTLPAKKIRKIIQGKYQLKGGSILDVGTGPGPLALALAKVLPQSFRMIGYDVSKKMLDLARGRADGLNIKMDFSLGPVIDPSLPVDARPSLPFETNSIDFIISHGSMHHWLGGNRNPNASIVMLNELYRILKPGGGMMIYDINPEAFLTNLIVKFHLLKKVGGEYQDQAFAHSVDHSFDSQQLNLIAKKCGLMNYKIYAAKPLFPIGLVFLVLEVTKDQG